MKILQKYNPVSDIWIDCYSTMMNTIVVSADSDKKYLVYNNSYCYEIRKENTSNGDEFLEVVVNISHEKTLNNVFKDEHKIMANNEDELIQIIEEQINKGRMCIGMIDAFYIIENSIHYNKNHIYHFALVSGFDTENNTIFLYETGNLGYEEFEIPIEDAKKSFKSADLEFYSYDRVKKEDLYYLEYSINDIVEQAKRTISSIDTILSFSNKLWLVKDYDHEKLGYFVDINSSHLLGIFNRYKANRLLCNYIGCNLSSDFQELEKRCRMIRLNIRKYYIRNVLPEKIDELKEEFLDIIACEKNTWHKLIDQLEN